MKKTLYSLLAFATLLFAASCAKEPVNVADPAAGGKPVATTFSVKLGGTLTKAGEIENSVLDDGTKVNVLYVGAYKDGALISTSKVDGSIPVTNKQATVTLTLVKGVEYDLVFFAEVAGKYVVNFADGAASFAYPATVTANDPELDAFYKTMKFTPSGTDEGEDVILMRPFAQVNVLAPVDKLPDGKTAYASEMTVTGAPTSFDLLTGKAVEPAAGASLTFASDAIDAPAVGKYGPNGATPAKWVGMNFVLVPEAGAVDLTFNETDMPAPLALTGIQVVENGRTNLFGNVFGLGDYTFNVVVNEVFDPENETPIDANEVTYVIDDGQTYTAANPLVIDTDAVRSVNVTINGVDGSQITLSDVNAKPVEDGKQVTVSSSDENVATVALDGNVVKITPVANGDAVITVSTPSFTKAVYAAATAKIYVKVTGMTVDPVDPELTVSADLPADGAPVSAPFSVTVTTNSTGTVSWTVNPETAATVAAGETAGTYTVTPATNLDADTPATVTFAVAAAEGFNAKTADPVSFTVAAAETPVEDPMAATKTETLPYEEALTTGQGDFKIYDALKPEALAAVWTQSSQYGMIAKAFSGSAYETESWLYTEDIDLGSATAPAVSFSHAGRYLGAITDVTLWIRESAGEWKQLAFSADVTNTNFNFVDNSIDLTAYAGKKIQIAFKYTSTTAAAGTYEIKNFKVDDASTPIETTISFAKESLDLTVGSTGTNAVTTNSTGAKTYTSSASSVAEVDSDGKVTAKAVGSATITVSIAADGRYTAKEASYPVTVSAVNPNQTVIAIDFTTQDAMPEGFPASSDDGKTEGTYTINGYSFTFFAADKFYWGNTANVKALFIGKNGSYVLLPAIEGKKLTKVEFHTAANASSKVTASIYSADGQTVVYSATDALAKDTDFSWTLTGTAVNTGYRFQITNANNFQFASLKLIYE